ncbi:mRNA triphosphatase CET1 [Sodiomyces alkalinus F11]|uniref:mRNA-capping enzyme subunit beta n=1 Tax=Sodiomyces alkalinus (strain CBS 110278 / VKM F-3762 / F11) TaxID=1314773 RepID=A0A3N2PPX9_SODAK|nr:mRNA triphosphatase CET1 [Sodiomyces alkalinus F11]ROT36558.1 mRNA triphosphatase CET1 [Sodiomyces alkalinus F11]
MDLRSLMNTSENDDRPRDKPAPPVPVNPPPHKQPPAYAHQQHPPPPIQTPTTPAHNPPSYAFRESPYSHALHSSPGKHPTPQEYSAHGPSASASYPPQTPYQGPAPYPAGPPHQAHYGDTRSPSASGPGPSPYRPPPSSSATAGYPFPSTATAPPPNSAHGSEASASPVQRHPHLPPSSSYPSRDSYALTPGAPHGATTTPSHPPASYMPQQQQQQQQQQHQHQHSGPPVPVPQTPPIGTPGGSHSYMHQQSQSAHSSPTPTSAQSQHHFGQSFPHGSPVPANKPPPPGEYNRQTSQPPTPLGPPSSAGPHQRQLSSGPPNFAQPPSPYQQRMTVNASQLSQTHATPPALPRASTSTSISISHDPRAGEPHRGSQSTSERDRSVSVSPKTRIPSLPSSAGGQPVVRAASAVVDSDVRLALPGAAILSGGSERERAHTPAKRKLADRDLSPGELEKTNTRPPPGQVNGGHTTFSHDPGVQPRAPAAQPLRKKPVRYSTPPPWAHKYDSRENRRLNKGNLELQKRGPPSLNGKPDKVVARQEQVKQEEDSRRNSPEVARPVQPPQAAEAQPRNAAEDLLGPWEPSITGVKPMEEISKAIADFLFVNVIASPVAGEITSRGIQFEIEAKLGTLIDKDTNDRVMKFIATECILQDTGRLAFRSSMTEAQHKVLNDWLNDKVVKTNPQNPDPKARGRVQVHYKHRREVDRFFEIPSSLQGRLPGCVRSYLNSKHSVKVRVTFDQKTGQPLNKIVKARVADLHLHMPNAPLDCRISVNLETAWDGPLEELEQIAIGHGIKFPDRNKDRLSYTHSHYQIDLTQVTQTVPGPGVCPICSPLLSSSSFSFSFSFSSFSFSSSSSSSSLVISGLSFRWSILRWLTCVHLRIRNAWIKSMSSKLSLTRPLPLTRLEGPNPADLTDIRSL